ncbi:class I SAM-dependent methyltransferase [Nonomuraea glycinis]|uniref:class I SAM-dependent methyltransferase n=1 Tax=Nonomuraea glycinis TaxID=2047744 RepID=UPI0033A78E4C
MTTKTDEFADRLLQAALGTIEILAIHLGDRLGWYRALAEQGPAGPAELAVRAGGAERYAREWLEQQAAAGILEVAPDGRFALPPGVAEVLTDRSSLAYLAPLARMLAAAATQLWSAIALARAYPEATVEGVDIDAPSVELARRNAAGLGDRVTFRRGDAAGLGEGRYDAVFAFECVHDMPHPVDTLAAARRALVPGGTVVVMDEAVGDAFTPDADELERLMYGFSLLICLPDGMSEQPSAATGTVMRPGTLRRYAEEAGFTGVDVLPISDFGFWRFYRLQP